MKLRQHHWRYEHPKFFAPFALYGAPTPLQPLCVVGIEQDGKHLTNVKLLLTADTTVSTVVRRVNTLLNLAHESLPFPYYDASQLSVYLADDEALRRLQLREVIPSFQVRVEVVKHDYQDRLSAFLRTLPPPRAQKLQNLLEICEGEGGDDVLWAAQMGERVDVLQVCWRAWGVQPASSAQLQRGGKRSAGGEEQLRDWTRFHQELIDSLRSLLNL